MAILHVFDARAFNVFPRARAIAIPPPDLSRITNGTERLEALLTEIRGHLTGRPMARLRLLSHGFSGGMTLSADRITADNARLFSRLRGLITSGVELHGCGAASSIPLRLYTEVGLNMGQQRATPGALDLPYATSAPPIGQALAGATLDGDTGRQIRAGAGVRFLMAFADAIGLPVKGAIHAQMPDPRWQFEGPTVTAFPGQALSLIVPAGDATWPGAAAGSYRIP